MPSARRYELSFFTATILEWKHLLVDNGYKDIILSSLKYLTDNNRIQVYAFVIMNNHLHLLWHIVYPNKQEEVQRDFLKYTAQMILKDVRRNNPELLQDYYVGAKDRAYQVWERNPLTIAIYSEEVMKQKLQYIHENPVRAGLCTHAEDYRYSSAAFYMGSNENFGFIRSCV